MPFIYPNVLSDEELYYLNNRAEVLEAKASLDAKPSGMVYFSVPTTDLLCATLQSQFGLDLSSNSQLPMRWIKGDVPSHVDVGSSNFQNTYLLYLNDSPGELVIDSQSYPIQTNTGFVFNEGVSHETLYTENVPRLLIGPMNEFAEPVGASTGIHYFNTQADALNTTNSIGYGGYTVYTVGTVVGDPLEYTSWRIASNSTGSSPQNVVYQNGTTLNSDENSAFYYLYPSSPCFLEGSTVLCQIDGVEKYVPVEELKNGTLVKTTLDGYKPVVLIGSGTIQNPGDNERTENRLYKCSTSKYPELKEDLFITGCHSILEFPLTTKQREDTIKHIGKLFVTDKKYRLMACIDERAEPWNSEGMYTIWHFALENADEKMNYGVYVNGGMLVETCSIIFLKNKSNMNFAKIL
jgi:hypothetical protein